MDCYIIKKLLRKGACAKSYLVEEKATKRFLVMEKIDITHLTADEYSREV